MKHIYLVFCGSSAFGVVMLLSQLAIAYPIVRVGVAAILVSGIVLITLGMAIAGLVAMRKAKRNKITQLDIITALSPALGVFIAVMVGVLMGGLAG